MQALMPTQPQTTGQLLKSAYFLFQQTQWKTFWYFFIIALSSLAWQIVGDVSKNHPSDIGIQVILFLGILLNLYVFYALFGAAIYRIQTNLENRDVNFLSGLQVGLKKSILLIAVAFLYSIIVGVGTLLLIIPGIILSVYLIFSLYLAALGFGVIDSLKESYRLVKDHWWRTAGNTVVIFLIAIFYILLIIGLIFLIVFGLLVLFSIFTKETMALYLFSDILTPILFCFAATFIYNYGTSFFLLCINDLKIRHGLGGNTKV